MLRKALIRAGNSRNDPERRNDRTIDDSFRFLAYTRGMKILYFSPSELGSFIARETGAELLSVSALQKEGVREIRDDAIGIVEPINEILLPRPLRAWLNTASLEADYIFAVLICDNSSLTALNQAQKLFNNLKGGQLLHYAGQINTQKDTVSQMNSLIANIKARRTGFPKQNPFSRFLSDLALVLYMLEESTGSCNRCGACHHICSLMKRPGRREL